MEPPRAMTTVMASSKASLVKMSEGFNPSFNILTTARPASSMSAFFSGDSAGWEEEPGRLMPSTSMAAAMVLAVYIPPQPPGPGQALHSMARTSSSVKSPLFHLPIPSKTETKSMSFPLRFPGAMVPP